MPKRLALLAALCAVGNAAADTAERPAIGFYRWQEDWSVLADPKLAREPGDALKYIPLGDDDPRRYLSFGVTLRERFESNDAPAFGVGGPDRRSYVIHRLEVHADAHLGERTRLFVQLENALAPGLKQPGPADANKLDLRLAFVDSGFDVAEGTFKYRIGRQEMAFDLQRFISVRDGPNVRQAYDAVWADFERDAWRVSGFASRPVQYRNRSAFDDVSNRHLAYGGVRMQHRAIGAGELSATYSEYRNDDARFPAAAGEERRRNLDLRYVGASRGFDWDLEGMSQRGRIGGRAIEAWAFGSLAGYTFDGAAWKPRVGLQADAASGDRRLADAHFGTFNPMFPNGYYVTLSGYTGYANFIHVKPSLTFTPRTGMKLFAALGGLWRETTQDAIFRQPNVPLPGTAGRPGRHTADYAELRLDWTVTRAWAAALEVDHYEVAPAVRRAGGHDSDYLGAEIRWGW